MSASSFRDPAGTLVFEPDRVVRTVRAQFVPDTLAFLDSAIAQKWLSQGHFIGTEVLDKPELGHELRLAHPRIFFPSYPWEWTPAQLGAAAELTLDLCEDLAGSGWILKDATPLNVLFDGPRPVFVDVLSVQRRDPNKPLWLAYGQFVRTFLMPLAAFRRLGWPLSATLGRRDGYEPEQFYSLLSPLQRIRAPWRSVVTLPLLLGRRAKDPSYQSVHRAPDVALAMLKHSLGSLRRSVRKCSAMPAKSRWSDYAESASHYSPEDWQRKTGFVQDCISRIRPQSVLDIGSNIGRFSRLAAQGGARVVGWDSDVAATQRAWLDARAAQADITALVADFGRPTPAAGWNNSETLSLLDRSRGRFDLVMMLAVVHHLLATHQIPLEEIAKLTRELTRGWLLIEWVGPDDPKFRTLSSERESLYSHLTEERFVGVFGSCFTPVQRVVLDNQRVLHLLETK